MGKFGETRGGVWRSGVLEHKSGNISESYYGGPIGSHKRSFERYHPRLHTASTSPRLGFAIISGTAKARDFKCGRYIHRVHPNTSPWKILEKRDRGRIQRRPKFWVPAIISGTRKATNFKFGRYIHRVHPSKRPLKIWEKRERGRIQGWPKFVWIPPIISGTRKATNFKFGRYIYRVHPNKSPLNIWVKRERWCIQGLPNFLSTLYYLRNRQSYMYVL